MHSRAISGSVYLQRAYCSSKGLSWTHYDVLELSPQAGSDQIKEAYYRLSKLNHPDHSEIDPDKTKKFHAIAEAYRILGTPKLRRRYDMGNLGMETSLAEVHKITHQFEGQSFYKNRSTLQRKSQNNPGIDEYISHKRRNEFEYSKSHIHNKDSRRINAENRKSDKNAQRFFNKCIVISLVVGVGVYQLLH
uniref:J domain-containing protein C3E7.11c n=1 Tax=Caligus clemensi TaxID=344056 RepID=C1C2T5_CALCM|nr:J domain-containing protein C3E7.11c [Caligus clemensi]